MKYNGRLVMVPWLGLSDVGEPTRNWSRLRFYGPIDRRRLKREVRKATNELLGRHVHPQQLTGILRMALPLYADQPYAKEA